MADRRDEATLLATYADHPMSMASIVARVRKQIGPDERPTELDLAVDPVGEITDQNHIGGALSTLRLAARAQVSREDRILDLGCGLGGPARLLATVFAASVHGIDLNPRRVEEARQLAQLINPALPTSFESMNIVNWQADARYSLVWGQNSWLHLGQPKDVVSIAANSLAHGGRVAFEDVCLIRSPRDEAENAFLNELCESWQCRFHPVSSWSAAMEGEGLRVTHQEEEAELFLPYLRRLRRISQNTPKVWPQVETVGYERACALAEARLIGYYRVIAFKDR